jgi:putative ABC transport system permease protein
MRRGTMLRNFFVITIRNFLRQKGYSFINITGLAVGMAVCILIVLWVRDELSYDRFHEHIDELHLVAMTQEYSTGDICVPMSPAPLAAALKETFPEIINVTRVTQWGTTPISYGEKSFSQSALFADPQFLNMFTFPLLQGDPTSALSNKHSIILSQELAHKLFGDENPMGKTVTLRTSLQFTVTGIVHNSPDNSSITYDFITPFEFLSEFGYDLSNWGNNNYFTYVQIQQDIPYQEASQKVSTFFKEHRSEGKKTLYLHPLSHLHLRSQHWNWGGNIRQVQIFSMVAVLVLVIACINFMNLSIAQSLKRTREIGLRKVIGAKRLQLIWQCLGETALLSLGALLLAVVLVELLLSTFNQLCGKQLSLSFLNVDIVIGLLAIIVVTGLIAGGYPAVVMSSLEPASALRGAIDVGPRKSLLRKVLVTVQFTISIALIIVTGIVSLQLSYMQNKKLGLNKDHIVYMRMRGGIAKNYQAVKAQLLQHQGITHVTAASHTPEYIGSNGGGWDWEGKDTDTDILMGFGWFGFDYAQTFDIEMAQGRFYLNEYASDSTEAVVVNEKALQIMGMDDPIGKRLTWSGRDYTIIGVVKDFHFKPLAHKIEPLVLFFNPNFFYHVFIKILPHDVTNTLTYIEDVHSKYNPQYPFTLNFLDQDYAYQYRNEMRMQTIFSYFAGLAILISCLGLLGLAAYMAEKRTKEIGIRKVLGASIPNILGLLSKEFIALVGIANVVACPLAYYAMNQWLQNFAYRIDISWTVFALAAVLALLIAMVTVSTQAIRAALANPVQSLRYE